MRWIPILVCSAVLAGSAASAAAQAQPAPAKTAAPGNASGKPAAKEAVTPLMLPPSPRALLPDALDGWVEAEPPKALTDAAQADPANAAALKEYDYTGGASATYKRDGETLTVRALRFQDASGAYGAYSFYRQNGWPKEDIGTGATSDHNRVLFWKGDTVVDATFSHIGPMSAARNARTGQPRAHSAGNQGACCRPSWPTCPRARSTGRPRTTLRGRQATRARAACCRRSWWASIAARRP